MDYREFASEKANSFPENLLPLCSAITIIWPSCYLILLVLIHTYIHTSHLLSEHSLRREYKSQISLFLPQNLVYWKYPCIPELPSLVQLFSPLDQLVTLLASFLFHLSCCFQRGKHSGLGTNRFLYFYFRATSQVVKQIHVLTASVFCVIPECM